MEFNLFSTFSNPTLLNYLETFLSIRGLQNHLSLWAELQYLRLKESISRSIATHEDIEMIYKKYNNNSKYPLNDKKLESSLNDFWISKDSIENRIEALIHSTMEPLEDRLLTFYENYENKKVEIKLSESLFVESNNKNNFNLKGGQVKSLLEYLIISPGKKKKLEKN